MSNERPKYMTHEAAEASFQRAKDELRCGLEEFRQKIADAVSDEDRAAVLAQFDASAEDMRRAFARALVMPKDAAVHVHGEPDQAQ